MVTFVNEGVRSASFIYVFLKYPMKGNNSVRLNYFVFIEYLKAGAGKGGSSEPPLDPPLFGHILCHCKNLGPKQNVILIKLSRSVFAYINFHFL